MDEPRPPGPRPSYLDESPPGVTMVRSTAHPRLPAGLGSPAVMVTDLQACRRKVPRRSRAHVACIEREESGLYRETLNSAHEVRNGEHVETYLEKAHPSGQRKSRRRLRWKTTPGWHERIPTGPPKEHCARPTQREHADSGGKPHRALWGETHALTWGEARGPTWTDTWRDAHRLTCTTRGPPGQTRRHVSRST